MEDRSIAKEKCESEPIPRNYDRNECVDCFLSSVCFAINMHEAKLVSNKDTVEKLVRDVRNLK